MVGLRIISFCFCIVTGSIFACQMDPITLDISGTVCSVNETDFCTDLGKLNGVCSSTAGYQIILKNVAYEVIQGPDVSDYEKGIVHYKDSLLIYSSDTLFRSLIGKSISISEYDLHGDEFSMRSSIETLEITSSISVNNASHVDAGEKTVHVSITGGMVRVSGIPAGKIWKLMIMDMAGRTVVVAKGGAQGACSEATIGKLQPGVYYCQLKAGDLFETQTIRIIN